MENGPNRWRNHFYLFWISFLSLFLEVALIRWLGVELRILAYFRNLVLISCFLGLGIGFSMKKYRVSLFTSVLLIAVLAIVVHPETEILGLSLKSVPTYLTFFPEFHMWGYINRSAFSVAHLMIGLVLGFAMLTMVVIFLGVIFIPFGQILGGIFEASDNRIRDYSINLVGSLLGVWAFAFISYLWMPPWVWFAVGAGGSLLSIKPRSWKLATGSVLLLGIIVFSTIDKDSVLAVVDKKEPERIVSWSPYQKIDLMHQEYEDKDSGVVVPYSGVSVNSVGFMTIVDLSPAQAQRYPTIFNAQDAPYYTYDLPYRFRPNPKKVLIVGAGGGNDVAAALRNNAESIVAVEIDPSVAELGLKYHPEKPYQNPRVNLIIDDARSFFKKTNEKFDMINFGLLDSHALTSNFTNINLDSYVYTRESFEEVKSHLADGGIVTVKFQVSRVWLGLKIWRIIEEVFKQKPLILIANDGVVVRGTGGTIFVVGDQKKIREMIEADPVLKSKVAMLKVPNEQFEKDAARIKFNVPEDNWPYLYLQKKQIPNLFVIMIIIITVLMYLSIRYLFTGGKIGPSHFLFLGAGFMLIEVHSISKTALLFGATWMVNTVIISAILVMIIAANMVVLKFDISRLRWWYAGLFFTLVLNYLVPIQDLFVGGYLERGIIAGVFYSLPMFFAGVIFACSIRRTMGMDAAFAANMLGAAIGGMLENVSYLTGLKTVVLVALLLYIASALALSRMPKIDEAS